MLAYLSFVFKKIKYFIHIFYFNIIDIFDKGTDIL
jgi:hypothetical protein